MHLSDEQIQRLLHGELAERDRPGVDAHLTECEPCRSALEEARSDEAWIFDLVAAVDVDAPDLSAPDVVARRPASASPYVRWAAGIVLLLAGAGAAYAAPGSPFRAWVQQLGGGQPTGTQQLPVGAGTTGIVLDIAEQVTVQFRGGRVELEIEVTDAAATTVETVSGNAAFDSDPEVLTVSTDGSDARFRLVISSDAVGVDVAVGDSVVFSKRGSEIQSSGTRRSDGSWLVQADATSP